MTFGHLAAQVSPPITDAAAARFLDQASWAATPSAITRVKGLGFSKYIDEQLMLPMSLLPDAPVNANNFSSMTPVRAQFFVNANQGSDQLRQRVMFALGQIWVVSGVKINQGNQYQPFLRILQRDAFANYEKIMTDVTLSPAMGHYLDMVNNDKPNPARGTGANENYAREVLQLFTLGLVQLHPDGTVAKNSNGNPVPTYNQDQVEGFARSFTGWTYPVKSGEPMRPHNPSYWEGSMVLYQPLHDTLAKTLLNDPVTGRAVTLPPGRLGDQDLADAIHNIFIQPTLAPFISRQVIQHLVTSSPSSAYVARVAAVFADNGQKQRGDMVAVIKAILLDTEARQGDNGSPTAGSGHLREPVLYVNHLLRSLSATVGADNTLANYGTNMGQRIYFPATVFNYFPPSYQIPNTTINAPEFHIFDGTTAISRADFANTLFYGRIPGVTFDLTPWVTLAADVNKLVDAVNGTLMHGTMSAKMRASILKALAAQPTAREKAQAALYLTASAMQYQAER